MKRFLTLLVALLVSFGLFLSAAAAQGVSESSKTDRDTEKTYLVRLKNPVEGEKKVQNKGEIKRKHKHLPIITVKMTPGKAKELENDPDVLSVEPDADVQIKEAFPWNISTIKADVVQGQAVTGQGVKIAVLDTGIDFHHEDLSVAGGSSFVDGATGYLDDNGHGTHVAGVIAALANGKGTIGVAPGASLYAVKVLDKNGVGTYSQVIAAMDWAIENKISIVCMSFGGSQSSQSLEQAMQAAYDSGILLVAAAGNTSSIEYPAKFPSVIAVGAVDQDNHRASFSATGPELGLVAPGVGIESTLPGNSYGVKNGTSAAAPHVAGAATLVWSAQPGLSNAQVRNILKQTAQPLGDANEYGAGLVDAAAALGKQQPPVEYVALEQTEISKLNSVLAEDQDKGRTASIQCLLSADPEVRGYAVRVLGEIGQRDDLDYLYKLRENDSQEGIRNQAALSIAKIEMKNSQDESGKLSLLALQLNSPSPQVRDFAVYQLSLLNTEVAKALAGEALKTETDPARANVLQSIAQGSGSTSAVSSLTYREVLDDGLVRTLYYNKIGDGQTIAPGQSARVSCQMDEGHSEVYITVSKNSNPSNIIASRTIYGTYAGQTISYTWYSSSSTSVGTYTIRFHCPDTGTTAYDVLFTIYVEEDEPPTPNDPYEPNDSRSQATGIQTGRSYTAYIESSSDKDYYRLVPGSSGTLSFSMTVPSSVDYDVDFTDSSGNILTGSYRGTGSSESFTYNLTGGNTYYIKVYSCGGYNSSRSYSFSTSFQPSANDPYEPNNYTYNATPIQLNSSYTSYIGYAGDDDYYRFVPAFTGRLSFTMTVPSGVDYDVRLQDSSDNTLTGSNHGTGSSESFTYDVTGGSTYYFKIYGFDNDYNGSQSYQFSTTLTVIRATLGLSVSAPGQVNSGQTFTVTATVSNTSTSVAANSVSAAISLPDGLQLASGQSTVSIGNIAANSIQSISWTVKASGSYSTVSRTLTVTASATNADTAQQSKTVTVLKTAITGKDANGPIGNSSSSQTERTGNYGARKDCEVCPVDTSTGAYVLTSTPLTLNGAKPFGFTVYYNALLLSEGPMGKGWGHNFETYAETLPEGNVVIYWDANRKNTFVKNASNQFVPQDLAIRFDTLVKNADGSYTLTRKDQSVYLFNSAGKLTEQKDGHGQSLTMTYDGSGRLTTITEPVSKKSLTLSYNTAGLIDSITDSLSRRASFAYDASHNLTGITDPAGNTTNYTYNAESRLLTIADAQGVRITNTYDDQGRVATQDDAVAGNQLAVFTYDETTTPGQVITTVTSRRGPVRVYTHDSQYQLLSIQNELGNTETYTYDADGNITGETDAASRTTRYTSDTRGNLLTATDPAGHVTRMTYDERDNLLSVENAAGKKITFTYDANNNPLNITDPLGNTTNFAYDSNGLMSSRTAPGSGTTTYSYQNGLLHSVTNPEGSTNTFGYDAAGRVTGITDGAGKTTNLTYDNTDNLLTVADPLGNTYRFTYDSRGNRLTETDPKGNFTHFEYNGNNKLTSTVDALGNRTGYQYDGEDRLVKITNARGYSTTLTRDAKGRVTGVTDPLGKTITFEYNAVDSLVGQYDSLGNRILTASYDILNNPVTVADALGNTTTSQYDVLSRLTAVTDPLGRNTQFGYDNLNRLTSSTDAMGGRGSQSFNAGGNRTALTDPNGNLTSFSFDRAGRLTAMTNAWGSATSYQYNNRNLVSQITNGRGQTASLQYDAAGRLTSLSDPAGTVSYTYDANGNVLTVSDSAGTINRKYDALNRVTDYTDTKGNTIRYDYDSVGNLTILTYPGGKQVRYDYDAANRLTRVTDWAGRVTSYEYDANYRLTRTSRPNGTTETRSYDTAGQLNHLCDQDATGNIILQYDYTYDGDGNVKDEESAVPKLPFTLDNAVMTFTSGNRLATFNGQPVSYDADGNMTTGPLTGQMANYVFDTRNRLVSAGNFSYQYDAENNRISVIDNVYNTQTGYVINPNAPLSQVLIQTDSQGNQTFYVYGLGLIGQEQNGNYLTYHFDLRGSTVALSDNSGNVTDRLQYAPYGEMVKHTGKTSTPFLYNGRYGVMSDSNGLYYMRARYYNPEIRRFINQDILLGHITKSQRLNRYVYVNGEPVSYIDPMGLACEGVDTYSEGIRRKENGYIDYEYYHELYDQGRLYEIPSEILKEIGGATPEEFAPWDFIGIGGIIKSSPKFFITEMHHLLPRQFKTEFEKVGLNIEDYVIQLSQDVHRLKPAGIHTTSENWNKQWKEFFDEYPDARKEQILEYLEELKKKYGI